jgi:hypothetical protein
MFVSFFDSYANVMLSARAEALRNEGEEAACRRGFVSGINSAVLLKEDGRFK